jgi:hypothetical protein
MLDAFVLFYQHDFEGRRLFQHRHGDKWDFLGSNRSIPDFIHENDCREFLIDLAQRWDGQLAWPNDIQCRAASEVVAPNVASLKLAVAMASCAERDALRAGTVQRLSRAGWPPEQVLLATDERRFTRRMVQYCLEHWFEGPNELDLKLGYLAATARQPFFFHCPSLVQHVGHSSTLGHSFRAAADFDAEWKATTEPRLEFRAADRTAAAGPEHADHD